MTPVLTLLDHTDDGRLTPIGAELVTLARDLGPVQGVWVGPGPDAAADQLSALGVQVLHHVRTDADTGWPGVVADCLAAVVRATGAGLVLLASTAPGRQAAAELVPQVAAAAVTDADAVALVEGVVQVTKTVLAGTWTTTVAALAPVTVVTVKPNAVHAVPAGAPTSPQVVEHTAQVSSVARLVEVTQRTPRLASGRPDLATADVVVVGGRGTDGHFGLVEELADALGGAVGATRVATDEGWAPREAQVGQTGVTVSPRLYIGLGVSGAVHHRGGMQASGTVVAVNNDPDAPIFEVADYGVVGDLFDVVPPLVAALRARG